MTRQGVCLFLVVSILLACSAVTVGSSAAGGMAGVRTGQWAEYAYTYTSYFYNFTGRCRIEVTSVVESVVYFNWTEYVGDQVTVHQLVANLSGGSNYWLSLAYLYMVCPNLRAGDSLYPGSDLRIDSTMVMTVAGVTRNTSYVEVRYYDGQDFVWYDVETGLMVRRESSGGIGSISSRNFTMTSNNIWTPQSASPEVPILSVAIIVLGLGSVALVASVAWIASRRMP